MNKKNISCYLFAFLLPLLSFAQGWERTYDTGANENINAIDHTLDGGLILGGSITDTPNDMDRVFLYKTDALGNVEWEYYDDTHVNESVVVRDLVATFDGNYLYCFDDYASGASNSALQKIGTDGSLIWEFDMTSTFYFENVQKIEKTLDGNYIIVGSNEENAEIRTSYGKIDPDGNLLWEFQYFDNNQAVVPFDITATSNGEYLLLCKHGNNTVDQDLFIVRIGADGTPIWQQILDNYEPSEHEEPQNILELANGNFVITGFHSDFLTTPNTTNSVLFFLTIDAEGNQLSFKEYDRPDLFITPNSLQLTDDGGFAILANSFSVSLPTKLHLISFDSIGNERWQNTYGGSGIDNASFLLSAPDKGFYLGGYIQNTDPGYSFDGYLVKTDSLGNSITNLLEGNVYNDENQNCSLETPETGLNGWLVKATKGNIEYATLTDSLGQYEIEADTGTYIITSYPISDYWDFCNNDITVTFTDFNQTINQDLGAQALFDCPLLDVSIGTDLLRRCFDNSYYVNYCNYGTTAAENAYIEITLDPDMIYQSATAPLIDQMDNLFTFDIGDIAIGECGNFQVNILLGDSTTCDSIPLGATHCVMAHVYPDSACIPTSNWSGASIEVDAICEGDSIVFFIQNTGAAPTSPNLGFIIIEDDVVLLNGDFELPPNQVETIRVAANGSFFRLEAQQEPNHPGMNMPNVSVEGCGDNSPIFSWGFTSIYGQNDGDSFIDIDCMENTGSYDPNDKTGFPLGRGDENYIDPGQDIEYLIRFQNTGTDTAFTVVIRDALSDLLDITSVRPGASSHPYEFDISGGNVLSFTFNNIMLPDSNVNLAGSNGFVKFKVNQVADLPLESEIYNSAAIFFDFNQPVITNTTLHTVGIPLIISVSIDQVIGKTTKIKVYPNPFGTIAHFDLGGTSVTNGVFELYNVIGQPMRQQIFSGDAFDFERGNLDKGVYFFRIEDSGALIGSGKLVVE